MKMMSPKGHEIIGTRDDVPGVCLLINEGIKKPAKGKEVEFQCAGETEMDWDGQRVHRGDNGERYFVCNNGDLWLESQIVYVEEKTSKPKKTNERKRK